MEKAWVKTHSLWQHAIWLVEQGAIVGLDMKLWHGKVLLMFQLGFQCNLNEHFPFPFTIPPADFPVTQVARWWGGKEEKWASYEILFLFESLFPFHVLWGGKTPLVSRAGLVG